MPELLTQLDLDEMRCACGGDNHEDHAIVLHSRCHMNAPTWTAYDKRDGTLTVMCSECDKQIARILVAAMPPGMGWPA